MALYNKRSQMITVSLIHIVGVSLYLLFVFSFWGAFCGDDFLFCLKNDSSPYWTLFFLSFFRPFLFMPLFLFSFMIGGSFSFYEAFFLNLSSAFISLVSVSLFSKYFGKRYVAPWLLNNFPKTYSFIRSQNAKIILFSRLVPILPFDLLTFVFGALDFKTWKILFWGFWGYVIEALILSFIGTSGFPFSYLFLAILPVVISAFLFSLYIFLTFFTKQKKHVVALYKSMIKELKRELVLTRSIVETEEFDKNKKPVLLLYGFFSSRSVLTNLERILSDRGYQVLSFNLGGLFEVFFTRGIIEAADHLDKKLRELFVKHDFKEINIVAHSKGGLVAFWWLQKFGGYEYCSKLITLGTPFRGTYLVWTGLCTPVGFFFRDLWQMRPYSSFVRYINQFVIPENFKLYSLYSNKDHVVTGRRGLLKKTDETPHIEAIPMHHLGHYDYLSRKDVGDTIVKLLASPYYEKKS